jgi:hypothetical protein
MSESQDLAINKKLLFAFTAIRDVKLQVEALKRMMFEHRPPFVPAFEHQVGSVEASGLLRPLDDAIADLERSLDRPRG